MDLSVERKAFALGSFMVKNAVVFAIVFCVVYIALALAEHRQRSGGGRPHIGGAGRGV